MAKKSKAQIKRLTERAAARGEVYIPPVQVEAPPEEKSDSGKDDVKDDENATTTTGGTNGDQAADRAKLALASKLKKDIEASEKDESLKAKDRRSAKRKLEAIAAEKAGCPAAELLTWYDEYQKKNPKTAKKTGDKQDKSRPIPYIVFIGQLSYDTTREGLYAYVKKELGKEHKVTPATVKVRVLTDVKTKRSRGMAFIEVTDPETLYALLKLHQTFLDGRRINVERSAGGGKHSETRQAKLKHYREEQDQYISSVVDKMLEGYKSSGEIQDGEMDEGVIALCKRHSATIVQAALENYMETNGRDKDNSSAYLSFLLTKFAEEGIIEKEEEETKERSRPPKRGAPPRGDSGGKRLRETSELSKRGVDMGVSEKKDGDVRSIFPSFNRGRGR